MGYAAAMWLSFGEALAAVAGALTGLLYWLIPAAVASLAGGVVNAWLFLVRVTG